jgi:2-phospho-L-lactate guanylyltransferase
MAFATLCLSASSATQHLGRLVYADTIPEMNPGEVLIAIPVKPFGVAKQRLQPLLDAQLRSRVGKAVASHVISQARETGGRVAVVTGDPAVAMWASAQGVAVIEEPSPGGLDLAAGVAVATARRHRRAWMVVHADLPAVTAADLYSAVVALPPGGIVLAPSHDGGTNLLAGDRDSFSFSYGRNSLRRHLAVAARLPHRLLLRPGLALDLDGPDDLAVLAASPTGGWLADLLPELAIAAIDPRQRARRPLA